MIAQEYIDAAIKIIITNLTTKSALKNNEKNEKLLAAKFIFLFNLINLYF